MSLPTKRTFISQLSPTLPSDQPALWFVFKQEEILLSPTHIIPYFVAEELVLSSTDIKQRHYLGCYGTVHCYALEVLETTQPPRGLLFHPFRGSHALSTDQDLFLIAARAKQILTWHTTTQFCSHCGTPTQMCEKERAKICPHCHAKFFPQLAPVVLILIWRNNEILLARSPHFPKGVYSILAGFVEPGETLEQAAEREVKEEVGIDIKCLQYFGSQPWPFPSQLMIGFMAEYAHGEINIDPQEITDAQWFSLNALPVLPNPLSLSRHMIEHFLKLKDSDNVC